MFNFIYWIILNKFGTILYFSKNISEFLSSGPKIAETFIGKLETYKHIHYDCNEDPGAATASMCLKEGNFYFEFSSEAAIQIKIVKKRCRMKWERSRVDIYPMCLFEMKIEDRTKVSLAVL